MLATSKKYKSKQRRLMVVRKWMQVSFVILIFLIGLRHVLPAESSRGGSFDAFCPFGGIETLFAYITTGNTLKTTNLLNFTMLLGVLGLSAVTGRSFCGWVCPLGSLQDFFANSARRIFGGKERRRGIKDNSKVPFRIQPQFDRWLRFFKYFILFAVVAVSMFSVYPPLHSICPVRAIFSFHLNTILLGFVLVLFVLSSMLNKRFTCKYLCPMGAVLTIFNKFSLIHLRVNQEKCANCGRCDNECPMDITAIPENLDSPECIRCLECLETCAKENTIALKLG